MRGSQNRMKLNNKLIGCINLLKHVFNGVQKMPYYLKNRAIINFELAEDGEVKDIHVEYRRIANQIIEESMIIANICCARFLAEHAKNRYI